MKIINIYGVIFVAIILIPNIIFAVRCKDGFSNNWHNRFVEIAEQIGRFGSLAFMIFNIPKLCYGWGSDEAFTLYLVVDAALAAAYCAIWAVCFKKSSVFRALALSILPSLLFLFSGIISRSIPLTAAAVIFAPSHIAVSYNNARLSSN